MSRPSAPTVSVVVPAYNCGPYIEQALRSALLQTRSADEIVVIDDGSTDDTPDRVARFDRVRYLRQDNAGYVAACNRGVAASRGEYAAFLDADDVWMPLKLEKQLAVIGAHPSTALVAAGVDLIDGAGAPLSEIAASVPPAIRLGDVRGGVAAFPSTWLFRRDAWIAAGGFTPGEPYAVDWEFLLKVLVGGGEIRAVPEALALRRVHGDQLGADYERLAAAKIAVARRLHRRVHTASGGAIGVREVLHDIHMEAAKNLFADPRAFAFAARHLRIILKRSPEMLVRPLFWAHVLVLGGAYGRRSPADAVAALPDRLAHVHSIADAVYAGARRSLRRRLPPQAAASTAIDLAGAAVLAQSGRLSAGLAVLGRIMMTRPWGTWRVVGRMVGRSIAQRLKHAAG